MLAFKKVKLLSNYCDFHFHIFYNVEFPQMDGVRGIAGARSTEGFRHLWQLGLDVYVRISFCVFPQDCFIYYTLKACYNQSNKNPKASEPGHAKIWQAHQNSSYFFVRGFGR